MSDEEPVVPSTEETGLTDDSGQWVEPQPGELINPKKHKTHGVTNERNLLAMERALRGMEMRGEGMTYEAIAGELGYSNAQNAHRAVTRHMRHIRIEGTSDLKKIRFNQLQAWIRKLQPAIEEGHVGSIMAALKVAEYQDKIMGVEAGTSAITNNLVIIESDEQAYIARMKQMAGVEPVVFADAIDADIIDNDTDDTEGE